MSLSFFTAAHSRLHRPSHIGVVARYLRNPPIADQVEPRVANVDVVERVIFRVIDRTPDDRRRGAGRSHAPQFGMREAVSPDLLVGRLQSLDQGGLRVVADSVTIDRHQRFHCQPARFLTALVATHAIRYDRQPPLAQELPVVLRLPIAKEIFVILPLAPDIRLARHLNSGANLHPGTISITGMTSIGNDCLHGQTPDYKGCGREAQTEGCGRTAMTDQNLPNPTVFISAIWPLSSPTTLLQLPHVRSTSPFAGGPTLTRAANRVSYRRRIRNRQAQSSARRHCPDLHRCHRGHCGDLRFHAKAET